MKRKAYGYLIIVLCFILLNCKSVNASRLDDYIVPLFLSYRVDSRYIQDGEWLTLQPAENIIQYRIDLDYQFYELYSITISFSKDYDHEIFQLDKNKKILTKMMVNSGEVSIPLYSDIKYITVAVSADEENDCKFSGTLLESSLQKEATKRLSDNSFAGKNLSVIGDSISAFQYYTPKYNKYPDDDVTEVSQMWWYILAKELDMNVCKINAYAGSGVSDLGTPDQIASAGRGKDLDLSGQIPDVVITMIGLNDFAQEVDSETIRTNYVKMLEDIQSTYPKADIFLSTYPHESMAGLNKVIRDIANDYDHKLIEMEGGSLTADSSYFIDGIHPNAAGMKQWAQEMKEELLG